MRKATDNNMKYCSNNYRISRIEDLKICVLDAVIHQQTAHHQIMRIMTMMVRLMKISSPVKFVHHTSVP